MEINRLLSLLFLTAVAFSCDSQQGPSMKIVIRGGEVLGRFIEETPYSYIVDTQDTCSLEKTDLKIETWKASDGRGIVYLKHFGSANAYSTPNEVSAIIGSLTYEEGYVPETYDCLGYSDGWFTIELESRTAYIQEHLVDWDAINTF